MYFHPYDTVLSTSARSLKPQHSIRKPIHVRQEELCPSSARNHKPLRIPAAQLLPSMSAQHVEIPERTIDQDVPGVSLGRRRREKQAKGKAGPKINPHAATQPIKPGAASRLHCLIQLNLSPFAAHIRPGLGRGLRRDLASSRHLSILSFFHPPVIDISISISLTPFLWFRIPRHQRSLLALTSPSAVAVA